MLRHFLNYLLFTFTMFAAAAPPLGGGNAVNDAGAGAGAPGTGGAGSGDQGQTPHGGAGQGAPPAAQAQPGADNIRQLREAYEGIKSKYEPWDKLGIKPEQVGQFQGVYQKLHTEVATLGRNLGYPDDEIAEAMAEDPVRTLDFLRNQAQQGQQADQGQPDLNELVQQHVEQVVGPIQQRENVRITNEANALFERTVHQCAVDSFKAEGVDVSQIPQDEMFMLTSAVSEILKYDEGALKALKYEGKTAAVQQAFQEARTYLDKYYLARSGRDRARVAPARPGQPPPQPNGKKPTLDEMIEDPGVVNAKYR